jgi:hypothetical protein
MDRPIIRRASKRPDHPQGAQHLGESLDRGSAEVIGEEARGVVDGRLDEAGVRRPRPTPRGLAP